MSESFGHWRSNNAADEDGSRRRPPSKDRRRKRPRATVAKWFSPIQPVVKGNSESQNSRCRLAQSMPPLTRFHRVQQMMMVVPVDADIDEAQHIAQKNRAKFPQSRELGVWGTFSSSTMIVMMMAITPSLKASSRPLPIIPLICF